MKNKHTSQDDLIDQVARLLDSHTKKFVSQASEIKQLQILMDQMKKSMKSSFAEIDVELGNMKSTFEIQI